MHKKGNYVQEKCVFCNGMKFSTPWIEQSRKYWTDNIVFIWSDH